MNIKDFYGASEQFPSFQWPMAKIMEVLENLSNDWEDTSYHDDLNPSFTNTKAMLKLWLIDAPGTTDMILQRIDKDGGETDLIRTPKINLIMDRINQELSSPNDHNGFDYYECRPVIESKNGCSSYTDKKTYLFGLDHQINSGDSFKTFWTLYGVNKGEYEALADFNDEESALRAMESILAPLIKIRDELNAESPDIGKALNIATNIILQSNNRERYSTDLCQNRNPSVSQHRVEAGRCTAVHGG